MELNNVLFPSPKFNSKTLENHYGELIFIPKPNDIYIPCLFLRNPGKTLSNQFLLFFHGNAEDIFCAGDVGDHLCDTLGINILIVEYPTYSIYQQETDTNKILDNSLIVFDFLVNELNVQKANIFVFGRSIGTSPAIYLCSKRKPGALISVSGFTSIRAAAESLVGKLLKFVINERFTSIEYIKDVTCPILFIHGQKDHLIPFEHSMKLKEACRCPYEIYFPEEMTHNEFDYEEHLLNPIVDFLQRNNGFDLKTEDKIKLPKELFEMPLAMKKILNLEGKVKSTEDVKEEDNDKK